MWKVKAARQSTLTAFVGASSDLQVLEVPPRPRKPPRRVSTVPPSAPIPPDLQHWSEAELYQLLAKLPTPPPRLVRVDEVWIQRALNPKLRCVIEHEGQEGIGWISSALLSTLYPDEYAEAMAHFARRLR